MVRPREEFLGSITQLDEDGSGTVNANSAIFQNVNGIVNISRTVAPTTGALKGAFWVDNSTPTNPKFTDSVGTTFTLGGGGVASGDLSGNYPNPSVIGGHFGPGISAESLLFDYIIEDGYFLKRYGSSIIGIDPENIISTIVASGDLSGTYPNPEVIAGHFNSEKLLFDTTIDDGYLLIRYGSSIIGKDPFSLTFGTSAGEDLSGTYPNPEVIAGHFNSEKLLFDTTINDGYLLIRYGSSIIGLNPDDIAFIGNAGEDLSGTYPNPEVIAAHFNSEKLLFDTTIDDGYLLIRYGSSIIGISYTELFSNVTASGDLSENYPDPSVIAGHFNSEKLLFGSVSDNSILKRSGDYIIGINVNNLEISGNVTGTLGDTTVSILTCNSDELILNTIEDGYVFIRDGYNIIGKNPIDLLNFMALDGYIPINEILPVTSFGQTIFTLLDIPLRNEIQFFINGQKQDPSDYSIIGTQLTWNGILVIEETDLIDISYFKLVVNNGGFIISGQNLASTLYAGNNTNGNNIEITNGDYITSSSGPVVINTDGYINGNLTVSGLVLKTSSVNPNIETNQLTLWVNEIDETVRLDGYYILPKKEEFSFDILPTESGICTGFNAFGLSDNSATWVKVNIICYRPLNTEAGITYADYNLVIKKGYAHSYEIIYNDEIFKTGTTELFSITAGFDVDNINIIITNDDISDTLHFAGYCDFGIIR